MVINVKHLLIAMQHLPSPITHDKQIFRFSHISIDKAVVFEFEKNGNLDRYAGWNLISVVDEYL